MAEPVTRARHSVRSFERGAQVGAQKLLAAAAGPVVGVLAGAAIGTATMCRQCDGNGGFAQLSGVMLGGPVGALAGILIGSNFPLQLPEFTHVRVLTVTDGPNSGYEILTVPPELTSSVVYLNAALDGTSAWATKQTGRYKGQTRDVNGDPCCTTAAFALLKPHVERHEGLTGASAPDSRWGIWQDHSASRGSTRRGRGWCEPTTCCRERW